MLRNVYLPRSELIFGQRNEEAICAYENGGGGGGGGGVGVVLAHRIRVTLIEMPPAACQNIAALDEITAASLHYYKPCTAETLPFSLGQEILEYGHDYWVI